MDKFILRNRAGAPVFIQQPGNLTRPTVRLTPTTFQWVKMLSSMADTDLGDVVEQCVTYAISNMAAIEPKEDK